jgi:hypothetical protein
VDLSLYGDEIQFEINQSEARCCLKIGVESAQARSVLNNKLKVPLQRALMVAGLKEAIPMVDRDEDHLIALEQSPWELNIMGVSPDEIFTSPQGKVPLVKTVG